MNALPANPWDRRLRIALQRDSGLQAAVREAGFEPVELPDLANHHFNRSVQQRAADGAIYAAWLGEHDVDLLLDIESAALTFVPDAEAGADQWALTHTRFDVPYVAHYVDPVTETMQEVDWALRWQLWEHPGWTKWIWDEAHAQELRRLGIPGVLAMPMAAGDAEYPTDPLPREAPGPPVGFVGHPATSWFAQNTPTTPTSLRPGLLAAACTADEPGLAFHEVYYDLYALAEPPHRDEPVLRRAQKAADYFRAKFGYNVYLALKQRDRFVEFLHKQLGGQFELVGGHWQDCLGIPHQPRIDGPAALTQAYRRVAICLNLIKGNAETALNQRHFEITAAGGFMLTYSMPELSRCFEIGKECEVFESERDLLDKIRYYLAHPQRRTDMALAGQRRTLRDHLYSHRLRRLMRLVSPGRKPAVAAV